MVKADASHQEKPKATKPKRSRRPLLMVEIPEQHKKLSVSVKESAARLLEEYKEFLTARTGAEVSLDAVVEALARTLERDSLFSDWRKERNKPSLTQ